MTMKPLRFLYLPNEVTEGDQVGPHLAFRDLLANGEFAALESYSYLVRRRQFSTHHDALNDLIRFADQFQPDVIFWQHVSESYPLDRSFFERVRRIASSPRIVWHDPDAYGRWIKPLDRVARLVIAESDVAVVKGLGYFAELVRRAGARKVIFAPESYDDQRFGNSWVPTRERSLDVVMIANLVCLKRIPWLHLPGGRQRKRLAHLLHAAYGQRFAVYGAGQGWKGAPFCRGSIAFDQQEATIRSAWISVNWSLFDDIPMYFSDRLPISMACGVAHITNQQPGFEHLLSGAQGIYFVHSPRDALDVADMLLSLPRERLIEMGEAAATFARCHLNSRKVYRDVVRAIREHLHRLDGA